MPRSTSFFAGYNVQHPNVAAQMREDQRCLCLIVIVVPVTDQPLDCFGLEARSGDPGIGIIGGQRLFHVASRQIERRLAHPVLALAIDRLEFGITYAINDGAEGSPRLDRLELFGIADQNDLGTCPDDGIDKAGHLF